MKLLLSIPSVLIFGLIANANPLANTHYGERAGSDSELRHAGLDYAVHARQRRSPDNPGKMTMEDRQEPEYAYGIVPARGGRTYAKRKKRSEALPDHGERIGSDAGLGYDGAGYAFLGRRRRSSNDDPDGLMTMGYRQEYEYAYGGNDAERKKRSEALPDHGERIGSDAGLGYDGAGYAFLGRRRRSSDVDSDGIERMLDRQESDYAYGVTPEREAGLGYDDLGYAIFGRQRRSAPYAVPADARQRRHADSERLADGLDVMVEGGHAYGISGHTGKRSERKRRSTVLDGEAMSDGFEYAYGVVAPYAIVAPARKRRHAEAELLEKNLDEDGNQRGRDEPERKRRSPALYSQENLDEEPSMMPNSAGVDVMVMSAGGNGREDAERKRRSPYYLKENLDEEPSMMPNSDYPD